jgi:hypothetical protein
MTTNDFKRSVNIFISSKTSIVSLNSDAIKTASVAMSSDLRASYLLLPKKSCCKEQLKVVFSDENDWTVQGLEVVVDGALSDKSSDTATGCMPAEGHCVDREYAAVPLQVWRITKELTGHKKLVVLLIPKKHVVLKIDSSTYKGYCTCWMFCTTRLIRVLLLAPDNTSFTGFEVKLAELLWYLAGDETKDIPMTDSAELTDELVVNWNIVGS